MTAKKKYYLRFAPAAKIDYLNLLAFYRIAEYTPEKKSFDTIHYTSVRALAQELQTTEYAIRKVLSNKAYTDFIEVDKKQKIITLKNHFTEGTKTPFVVLSSGEVAFLQQQKDNLLAKYFIFLRFYCKGTQGHTDFTAKQFLSACGYGTNSNEYLCRISSYNGLLTKQGFLKIEKYRDELGHTRNVYSMPC